MLIASLLIDGYSNPRKLIQRLSTLSTPFIGFISTLIRGLLISLLSYLPQHLNGNVPSPSSYFTFIPDAGYFLFLTLLSPFYVLVLWLISGAFQYCAISIFNKDIDANHIFNLSGIVSLIIGIVLIGWDWLCIIIGLKNVYLLGISHLVIDIYALYLSSYGLNKLLKIKFISAVIINLLFYMIAMPFAILIMRAPL